MSSHGEASTRAGRPRLPPAGKTFDQVMELMAEARREDVNWREGRIASLVYYAGDDLLQVAQQAYLAFFSENGMGGSRAFPSLQRFEAEVVGMAAALLHGERAVGNVTSGGTESNLLAVKTARDRARAERPEITAPEILMPFTAHPSLSRGAHYFGLKSVRTPVGEDLRADVAALRAAVTDNTVLIAGSAPCSPHGVVDPIPEMARIAEERGISFHVDACMGGFMLPFLGKLGHPVPRFDFQVPGVTSMSADLHKYGFTAKGASTILYRDAGIYRYQGFEFRDWPSGLYSAPTLTGTRPGGAIAAAWAVMNYLGEEGYLRLAERIMKTARVLMDGINRIPGLEVWGKPDLTVFAYGSRTLDNSALADGMAARGWYVNRGAKPPGIRLIVTPAHEPIVGAYLEDLAAVADQVARGQLKDGGAEVTYA